jgi:two-component system phosphate regulon response regulator PhoB
MTVPTDRHRILIVDDDPACRALLDAIFNMHGFEVTATDSVLGASELVARVHPTVILLDLALPYRSGASWLAQLKADPATAQIPVVILSASPDVLPSERRELAQAVVGKPFRTRALVETVHAVSAGRGMLASVLTVEATNDSESSRRLGSL